MTDPAAEPAVLAFAGDVDLASEDEWRRAGDAFLADHPGASDLVVDASRVTFLDSRGMAVLVYLHGKALERGGKLTVKATPARIAKALAAAGLDQVFAVD